MKSPEIRLSFAAPDAPNRKTVIVLRSAKAGQKRKRRQPAGRRLAPGSVRVIASCPQPRQQRQVAPPRPETGKARAVVGNMAIPLRWQLPVNGADVKVRVERKARNLLSTAKKWGPFAGQSRTVTMRRPLGGAVIPSTTIGSQGTLWYCDNMDSRFGVPGLPDESVALTFTSPPYWNYVDYGEGIGTESYYEEYIGKLGALLRAIAGKTTPGGRVVVNASNMKSRAKREGRAFIYPIIADIIRQAATADLTFFDEIIWVKGHANAGALNGKPLFGSYPFPPTPKILDSTFENIMVFTKAGKRPRPTPDARERSRLSKEEWFTFTRGVWEIPPDKDPHHPATFPMEIAERIVRLYSFVDDCVLDPFAGTGTTLIAAERQQRRSIGFEVNRKYHEAVRDKALKWLPGEGNARYYIFTDGSKQRGEVRRRGRTTYVQAPQTQR